MYIELDLTTMPPVVSLREVDDFTTFKIVASQPEYGFIARAALEDLAGERANDPEWRAQLEQMLDYAQRQGWIGSDGAVRLHFDWRR